MCAYRHMDQRQNYDNDEINQKLKHIKNQIMHVKNLVDEKTSFIDQLEGQVKAMELENVKLRNEMDNVVECMKKVTKEAIKDSCLTRS